jgi:hypothetical protein
MRTVAAGAHGSSVAGTHGAGVNAPAFAAVAACTAGFAGDLHIVNDWMFLIGRTSLTVASTACGGGDAAL